MRDAGVDIQAHSVTHQDLRKPPYDRFTKKRLPQSEYESWLENEVAGSKQIIEQKLGVKVNCFAVPYGFYNEHVKEVAIKAGYEALFTVYGQKLTYGSPMDSLGRYMIEANKPKVFADAIDFGGMTDRRQRAGCGSERGHTRCRARGWRDDQDRDAVDQGESRRIRRRSIRDLCRCASAASDW